MQVDFPFKVSPAEQDIITMQPNSSLILLGRSGTGKASDFWWRFHSCVH